ncbi:MAG: hypothetical protein GW780_05545, partial [Candidatus Aenigmarchaeota archaeon]|nr:hypothetical protein [Candidatus Aenigmarchaeota archaeon]
MKQNKRIKAVFFDLGNTLVSSNEFMENKALKANQKLLQSISHNFSLEELKKAHEKA